MTLPQEEGDLSLPAGAMAKREVTGSNPSLVRPVRPGILTNDLSQSRSVLANLTRRREFIQSNQFQELDLAEDSLRQIKEMQVQYTNALNVLSDMRKLASDDLSRLRIAAARLKRESEKSSG